MKSLEIVNEKIAESECLKMTYSTTIWEDETIINKKELQEIKADLEVLEVLKKYLGYNIFIRYLVTSHIGIDEYKKVMKFLEEKKDDN